MKKNFMYAIMSAIALVGTVSFSACSSSDEIIDNPNYNPETNAVKTQFTISVTKEASSTSVTRMSEATVQGQVSPVFRGLDQMVLIPYGKVTSGDVDGDRLAAGITLNVTSPGVANTLTAFAHNNSNSYVYSDVDIPLGTYGFLFYGKAVDATAGTLITTAADKFTYGYLTPSDLTGQKETFGFSLESTKGTSTSGIAGPLLTYVKNIAAAAGWATAENAAIKKLYTDFVTMKAGSSTSIRAALEDLYESIMNNQDAVSLAIKAAIEGASNANATYSATENEKGEKLVLSNTLMGYPADINLPDGAVALKWSSDTPAVPSWAEEDDDAPAPTGGGEGTWNTGTTTLTGLDKYVFPASLYYRANSPVVVSNKKESDNYGSQTWAAITNTSTGLYRNGSVVDSKTQSVALVEQIDYAVAQLKSTITIPASATLKDRNGDVVKIGAVADGNDGTFTVTGILIGGQRNVNWKFLPNDADTKFYTIYDKEIPSTGNANVLTAVSGSPTTVTNYTLALENTADEEDKDVYIAIEFVNNAKDFMGKDGLIAKGTKFYLVATLHPANGGVNYSNIKKVFKQDYVTTANFTISANAGTHSDPDDDTSPLVYTKGLGAAYNVVPDLRTPQMELGLSVDLSWSSGLTFDIDDLGQ